MPHTHRQTLHRAHACPTPHDNPIQPEFRTAHIVTGQAHQQLSNLRKFKQPMLFAKARFDTPMYRPPAGRQTDF